MKFFKGKGFDFEKKDRYELDGLYSNTIDKIIDKMREKNKLEENEIKNKLKDMLNLFVDTDKNNLEDIKIMMDSLGLEMIIEDSRHAGIIRHSIKYKGLELCYFINQINIDKVTDIIETPYFTENKQKFQRFKGK